MKKLEQYDFPSDLKDMTDEELNLLAIEIREFLIDKVSKTGGHVASNLGAVELTIALHRVFDSPRDKIIWDVGHQSYVHKILTGRADGFDTLRQFGGMSGFPKHKESEHDIFDTGHSTTSLSSAYGMAIGRDIQGQNYEVVAVIGDGSLTGGMAYEALDNIGYKKPKMIIILNDNGMSISKNVGGISRYLGDARTSGSYLKAKKFIKEKVDNGNVGHNVAQGLANLKNDIKYTLLDDPGVFFERLGITYFGPVDGHDIKALIFAMKQASTLNESVVIHCITKKGKGYINAERYPRKFHGLGPFDPETGELLKKASRPSYSKVMGSHLTEMALNDKRIVAITAAMGEGTGLTDYSIQIPGRYYDVGIAEEHAVTFAGGLAKSGLKPMVCIYSSFLQRAYDQIMEDVCLQGHNVVFLLDRAGAVGDDGETHHGIYDIAYLSSMPGMTILAPSSARELREMMDWSVNQPGPVAIRYPRGESTDSNEVMSNGFIPGSIRLNPCNTIDIWSVGNMYDTACELRKILAETGINAGHVHVSCVKPLDLNPYTESAKYVITLEDHSLSGGFGQHIAAGLTNMPCQVISYGWPDAFLEHGKVSELMDKYGLTAQKIAKDILTKI